MLSLVRSVLPIVELLIFNMKCIQRLVNCHTRASISTCSGQSGYLPGIIGPEVRLRNWVFEQPVKALSEAQVEDSGLKY